MRKILDVVSALLALISTLFLFVGDMFTIKDAYGWIRLPERFNRSFLGARYCSADFVVVFSWLVVVLFIFFIGFLVKRIFTENNNLYSKKYIALPIISFVSFFFVTIFMLNYVRHYTDSAESISANSIYYIEVALIFIILIVQMYVYFGKFPTEKKSEKLNNDLSSQLEEINELLNKNMITQEEFDQKKKQLLGL